MCVQQRLFLFLGSSGERMSGTFSLLLLPNPLWSRLIVPVRIPSMGQIDLFEKYQYRIGMLETHIIV